MGVAYYQLGHHQEAIGAYKQAIRINPNYANAHYNLGVVYGKKLKCYHEAIKAYNQAVCISPDFTKAHYNLGAAYCDIGHWDKAIEAYKQAIRINPNDVGTHYRLGMAYLSSEDKNSALAQYKILKNLDKDRANELFNLIDSSKTEKLKKKRSIQQPTQPPIIQETKMKKDDTQLSGLSVDTFDKTITKKNVKKDKQESEVSGNKMLSYLGYFALMVACIACPVIGIVIGVVWAITVVVKHLRK
ncbi:tetratricopeptide repeat protein [bacterium]|nr:tetratricopeptide repeat protein [bacterium]